MKLVVDQAEESFPPRNSQGRPVVPRLDGKGTWTFSRPSSFGKLLLDQTQIERSYRRKLLRGAGLKPALAEQAVPLDIRSDRAALDELVQAAGVAGGDGERADLGTSMHTVMERYVLYGEVRPVADKYVATRDALFSLLERHDIAAVNEHWVEPFCINYDQRTAGSFDLGALRDGVPTIFDLKTGAYEPTDFDLPVSQSIQLYLYASSTHFWRAADLDPEPIPLPINQEVGYIIWAPLEQGIAKLYEVDLTEGKRLVELAQEVRQARSAETKRNITKPVRDLYVVRDTFFDDEPALTRPVVPGEDSSPAAGVESDDVRQPDSPREIEPTTATHTSPQENHNPSMGCVSSGASEASGGLTLAGRIGRLRTRLTTLVDRSDCTREDVVDIMKGEGLPALSKPDSQTEDTVAAWETVLATLELAHGIEPPDDEKLTMFVHRLDALPRRWFSKVEQEAVQAGVPNLKMPTLLDCDLDQLNKILIRHEVEAAKEAEQRAGWLVGVEDPEALVLWASDERTTDPNELDDLEAERLCALCEMYQFPDEVADPTDALLDKHGSKKSVLSIGRKLAKRHGLPSPASAKDVASSKMLAALTLNHQPKE